MTTYGISYWNRPSRKRAHRDATAIERAGFAWVNLPVSEERMAFDRNGVGEVVDIFGSVGLEVRLSPWGVGGLFGGEGIASRGDPMLTVAEWLNRAVDLQPHAIYWDEPKGVHGATAIDLLSPSVPIPQHVYLNPKVGMQPSAEAMARMASVGFNCYDGTDALSMMTLHDNIDDVAPLPTHVWVRAFGVDDPDEPAWTIRELRRWHIDNIAVWGYPSPGCSVLDCAQPRWMWEAIEAALAEPIDAEEAA